MKKYIAIHNYSGGTTIPESKGVACLDYWDGLCWYLGSPVTINVRSTEVCDC